MAKNRWELEEKRKQKALAAMQAALKSGAAYKGNAVQQTVSSPVNPKTAQSTLNTARSQSSAQRSSSGSGRSRNSTNTIRPDTTARTLPDKLNSLSSLSGSTERRSGGFSGGGGAGTRLPRVGDTTRAQRSADFDRMEQNSVRWHFADDKEREALRSENDKIRAAYGLTYDPGSGRTYGPGNIDLSRDVGERVQDYLGQGVLSTIGHNTGAGIAGINQAAYSTLDFLLPDVITPDFMQDYIDRAKQDNADIKQSVQDYNYARGGKLGGKVGDLYQSAIEMAPQAVIALMTGNLSTGAQLADTGKNAVSKVVQQVTKSPAAWASFFQTVGNDYEEAKANGANDLEAAASAIISSGINAGIEMTGGLETTGARPKNILNWLKGMNEEGREEVVQGIVSGLTQKGVYDADKPWLTTGSGEGVIDPVRMAQEYGAGAFLSGVMTAPGTFAGRRSTGTQTAQTGDYPAGAQNTAQGGIEQSVSPSGFIVPEAKRRRMAAQDAEYAAQIDGVFNGSMPTDRVVSIGDTPDILLSIGATDLPMTMTQSTARKIAFPAGYMGGSHNLGIPALKRLPEQMRDPAAVLRSKTQPDSFVILTEWNDTNGNPVIIALHLDKQGVVDVTNEVASAYGKNNFAALTGENGENVLYTKNNKSIDQILDNRLQLPALLSDDTLVAYSIAQNSGEGKRQEAINEIDLTPATAIRRSTTDGHITMQSGLFNNSIAQNGGEGNPAQPDSQAIGQQHTGLDDFTAPLTQTLVKIDEQMRIAENLPAGPARESRIQALREGARDVSQQLAAIENNRAEISRAQTIAERFGAKFALADLGPAGGKYENGTITINPYSSSPVRQVLVHELTHHLETSGQYDALQRQALSMFAAEQGVDVDALRANIMQLYAQNGVQLDADGADRELTAVFCENRLFTDEASIQRLAQTDRNLFERIRQWIADTVARLRGTPEQREMLRLQQMYERAAKTAGQREGYRGAQYSIDGRSTLAAQRAYREAVESGDTQTAEEILRQRYRIRGYSPDIDNRMMHVAPNSKDGYSARLDDLTPMYGDDIYSPDAEYYFGTGESYDGAAIAAIQNAHNNPDALVTVYRAIPSSVQDNVLRNGDWVTTVEDYAREHGERTLEGAYRIIEETVPARYLYGNGDSIFEFGYDNGNNEVYRNAVGNAKTAGVTYDDYGDLIPLSQRFDERNPDRRYTFGFTPAQIATAPEVQVPLSSAIQYGATPEQAMREAGVRAQGEAVQAARETQLSQDIRQSNPTMRPDNPYFGLSRQQLEMERDFARQRLERARSDRRPERAQSMQTQLDQIEAALEDAQQHDFKRGDRVFALDRNNFGEIIDDRGDGYFDVYFVNGQTGENGIHTLHGDLLQSIVPGEDVPRLTPKDAAEITGDITDYSPEEFDRIVSEAPDQYEAMPKRDLSRFGGGRLRGGEEQMQKDIEAMTEEADQQGAKQIVPESVARNISPVHMAYNKTLERVLDEAAGVSETIRTFFRDTIEKPLAYAKGLYARNIKTQMDDYYKAMQETGIRLGSKESAAVMWYGEGQRVNEEGDIEKYTLEHLKRDFPKKWKDIVKADSVNRRIYDEYIQKIQKARREVYPYAEQRVELAINRRRAQAAAFSEQIKNLDAKIASGTATAAETASRRQLMRELQRTEQDLAQKIKDRDSGKAFANQRLFPRKDFYHHTMEMAQGFSALKNILDVDSNIDPRLVGKSDNTRPNAKWSGILQRRRGVNALEDSVAAMLDYIPQAEYMINIDPQVARMRTIVRDLVDGTANADQTNANSLIEWLTDYTNDLAGKTNPFDRALQKVVSRKAFKALEWLNGRAKSNAILGNLNSALSQVYNLPNGLAYIHDPRDISAGLVDFAAAKAGNDRANSILQSSNFLTERYLDKAQKQFDESLLHKPKQFAEWLMTAGDEQVAQMIYFSAYEQALRRGEADPVFYADDITRRAIAGRGVGETPLMQKSKIVQLIAPFQVEVSNAYYVIKEKIGARDALGLTLLFLSTFLLNELKEDLTGTRTGMDLIDAGSDAIKEVLDPEYEGNTLNKMLTVATRLGGEVLSNMPFGSQIASTLVPDETRRTKLFGESDPTRFGTGNIGINALLEPVGQFLSGQEVNPWDPLTNLVMPWGGRQASRVVDMAEDYGLLPIFRIGQDGVRADRQDVQASYSDDGSRLRFPMDTDIGDILKGLAFGRYATDAGKAYIEGGLKMLSEDKTAAFTRGVTEQGIDEATLYDVIVKIGQAEPVKDAEGNTLTSSKQVARRMLFDRDDLTAEQKRWIDEQLLIDPDSDQQPADYTDYNTFMLHNISDSRKDAARDAIATGLSIDQFVQWDDRLSELIGEKDENDKKVRTEAEARNIVLDEVMQDSMLSDSEKQAIADYVIISSIGEEDEKTREDWETIAKGKVNASDFVRFQADASVYDDWAEGTGTDNAANVAAILRGYDGLTDEERDVLFQTYRENMSVNPFHVSVYEKSIDPNGSFYGALTDDGKARLRSLLNEYEQDINEGTELSEWRAKAYMAEKEAGISPATYAMYRVALETANTDGKGNPRQSEAEACVNAMDGLTQYQKAYLYASTNSSWKNNPFGSATVGEYSSGQEVGINPVAGAAVTSRFGPRDSFQTDNGAMSSSLHPSIDIGAAEGTPIGAYKSGKVTQNGWVNGYGWTIEVTHSDGTVSAYHHMMEQSPVAVGTEVKQGEQIGKVGQTGNSKGAHLDLTITRDGKPIDPATLIPELQDSATGYVWTGSNVYTNVTSGSSQSSGSSGGSSGSSGGSSGSSGLKSLDNLLKLDGLF